MRRWRPYLAAAVVLAVLLPATVLQARVFRRWAWSPSGQLFNPDGFGKRLYRAVMELNGAQADVSVVACPAGLDGVRQGLAAGEGVSTRFTAGEGLGAGEITGLGRAVQLVALTPGGDGTPALMVAVEQGTRGRATSSSAEVRHGFPELPLYPGSRVTRFWRNQGSRTALETAMAPASPAAVAGYYASALKREGWALPLPPRADDEGGLLLFVRGRDVCCVQAQRADSDSETRVTLLHKRGALD